jgi:hypothetical protein
MTAPVEDVATLGQELTAARLQRDQLRRALGRIISLYRYTDGAWVGTPVTDRVMGDWRNLYVGTAPARRGGRTARTTHEAVIIGHRRPERTEQIWARLVDAGLTEAAAEDVASQPLTMPIRLAPGVIISVFEVPS